MLAAGIEIDKEVRRIKDGGFRDVGGLGAVNELKEGKASFGKMGEWRGGFSGSTPMEEREKCPLLAKSISGIRLAPVVALQQKGVASTIHTPDHIVASPRD